MHYDIILYITISGTVPRADKLDNSPYWILCNIITTVTKIL